MPCRIPAETVVPPVYVLVFESVTVLEPALVSPPVPATVRFVIVTGPLWTRKIWLGLAPLTVSPLAPEPLIVIVPAALFSEGSWLVSAIVELAGRLKAIVCAPAPAALA